MMCGPKISARMQPEAMIAVLIVDVAEKIFIGRDTERGSTAAPLDLKAAVRFDFRKIADLSGVSHDVTVAHDTAPAATGAGNEQGCQECDRNLIHNSTVTCEMSAGAGLDSRICRTGLISKS